MCVCVCDKVVCEKVVCERVVCEDGRRTRRVDGWIGGRGCTKQRCGEQWQAAATMLRCICLAVSFSDFHWNQQKRFSNPLQTHILLQSPPRAARIEVAALQLQWAPHFWSPLLKCSSVMRPVGSFPGNTTPCQPHCWRHKVRNAHWLTRKPTQLSFFQALGASNF